jgi:3-methylcrotonyl-CoA carboxylase alpha subunit
MFESVLIANRGEIACRIIRTCKRLGVRSIAVYSDADRDARHVHEADDAVRLGPAEATKSYLDPDAIFEAAEESGAEAIHPGYGFLSEKPVLARGCVEHGLVWIGPRAEVIESMGSKTEAKKIAHAAGVTLVPGYHGDDQSPERLAAEAETIGYPVLIKASAGGGGKGMRRVERAADFAGQLALAKQEAARAFGDDRVLVERLIARPRHLEVQLAGDRQGNLIHLFERECSVQRNYQKVIEEAPAAFLSAAVRAKLTDQAVKLGKRIGYDSLGTVEFVLGVGEDEPYFLEMNTRLQVEHPVTEHVTGLDLVELQMRIAAGEPLPLRQEDVQVRGWAIEARVNCENPAQGYRPELGTLVAYREPKRADVRVESGVEIGSTVSPYYDSMIAKLIGQGATRPAAVRALLAGLDELETLGVGTNQLFLADVLSHPHFEETLSTDFIAQAFPEGWSASPEAREIAPIVAAFGELHGWRADAASAASPADDGLGPWRTAPSFRNVSKRGKHGWARYAVTVDGAKSSVWIAPRGDRWLALRGKDTDLLELRFDGARHIVATAPRQPPLRFGFYREGGETFLDHRGDRSKVAITSELRDLASIAGDPSARSGTVSATLPGLVTTVNVSVGQQVQAGDVVVVMESMKLMFPMEAPLSGEVAAVLCSAGQQVATAQALVEITPTK